jgi:carbon-monoxide dehydrogenase small subunit
MPRVVREQMPVSTMNFCHMVDNPLFRKWATATIEPPLNFSSDGSKFPSSLYLEQLVRSIGPGGPMPAEIQIRVNGKSYETQVEPRLLLVHYLRDILGLTGTHVGCETSICGACTVLLDGKAIKSCTVLAVQASGSEVTTIEGVSSLGPPNGNGLHPVQEGFWEKHGLQCGFCTPGMILASVELLRTNPNPSQTEIRQSLSGNLCRCTGYQHIIQAVEYAAKKMKSRKR